MKNSVIRLSVWCIVFCLVGLTLPLINSFGQSQLTNAIYSIPLKSRLFKDKSPKQITEYLKKCNINAVVHVPLDNLLIENLQHEGIRTYAEIKIFFGEQYWKEHPESRPLLSNGSLAEKEDWYAGICPSQEWLIEKKIHEVEEIVKTYHIDGVWLDFIRWPTKWEEKDIKFQHTCFCDSCLERFQKEKNINIPENLASISDISAWIYKNHAKEWYKWRCDVIIDTVRRIKNAAKKIKKDILIGIFIVPWREGDFDDAIYKVIGQDIERLSDVVDVFSPMSYYLLCHKDAEWIVSINQWLRSKTDKRIWPIIQSPKNSDLKTLEEYEKALRFSLKGGANGTITFTTDTEDAYGMWEIQKRVFK